MFDIIGLHFVFLIYYILILRFLSETEFGPSEKFPDSLAPS